MKASAVRPITYLKNHTTQLVDEVANGGNPVVITQNGEARVVMLDVASYDRWREALALLKLLAQSEADIQAGRTVPQTEAFARARAAVDRVEQKRRG
jgi:prevent-host-death family protein